MNYKNNKLLVIYEIMDIDQLNNLKYSIFYIFSGLRASLISNYGCRQDFFIFNKISEYLLG